MFFSFGVFFIIKIVIKFTTVQLPTSDFFNKLTLKNDEHPSGSNCMLLRYNIVDSFEYVTPDL